MDKEARNVLIRLEAKLDKMSDKLDDYHGKSCDTAARVDLQEKGLIAVGAVALGGLLKLVFK